VPDAAGTSATAVASTGAGALEGRGGSGTRLCPAARRPLLEWDRVQMGVRLRGGGVSLSFLCRNHMFFEPVIDLIPQLTVPFRRHDS
jgi:hypothetical protein